MVPVGVVVKDIAIGAGRFGFDSRIVTAAMFLLSFVAKALSRGDEPDTCYTLRRNTASIMKI